MTVWQLALALPWRFIALGAFAAWAIFWQIQGWLLSHHSGYTAPRLTCAPQLVRWLVSSLAAAWFVGPVRISGWENVEGTSGNVLIGPNHQIEADAILVGVGLRNRFVRFLMAINQTKGFLRSPFFAWMGAISVGYSKENRAGAAVGAAVDTFAREAKRRRKTAMIVFPQGSLVRDDIWQRRQFFRGIMKIARLSSEATGEDYWILPVVAAYDFDASHAGAWHRFVERLGCQRKFFGQRIYGVTIRIGIPLLRSRLPADDDAAMDEYFQAMLRTKEACRNCG